MTNQHDLLKNDFLILQALSKTLACVAIAADKNSSQDDITKAIAQAYVLIERATDQLEVSVDKSAP